MALSVTVYEKNSLWFCIKKRSFAHAKLLWEDMFLYTVEHHTDGGTRAKYVVVDLFGLGGKFGHDNAL